MKRREVIALIGSAVTAPFVRAHIAGAQEPGRTYKLGALNGSARQAPRNVAFFDELRGLGFVEGQNLKIIVDGFGLRDAQFAEAAATLAKSAPDVIFCSGNPAMRAAQESTRTVPIVGVASDMVGAGFVRSLARPGGNVTGVSLTFEVDGKRQDLLMEAMPEARRFAFLTDPTFLPPAQLSALQNATRARGVDVAVFTAEVPEQIAPTMDKAKAWGADALNVLSAPLFSINRRIVIERAAALGLPAIYIWPEMAEEDGLIGYGPRLTPIYRQLARLFIKVLRGVKPEDIPVEEPAKFDLVVNLKTAKALGLTIPESFLTRADKVIE
jgi:putative ABC transport system substrate-binding protein